MTTTPGASRAVRGPEDLTQSIAPTRDLWPGIAQAIAAPPAVAEPAPHDRLPSLPERNRMPRLAMAVAASVMLVAIGVWMGRQLAGAAAQPSQTAAQAGAGVALPAVNGAAPVAAQSVAFALDPRSSAERQQRLTALASQIAALSPATRQHVQASLAAIEKSMLEIQQALGKDPGNLLLQELLVNSYQDEMRVMGAIEEANRMTLEQGL